MIDPASARFSALPAAKGARSRWRLAPLLGRKLSLGVYMAVATTLVLLVVSSFMTHDLLASGREAALLSRRASSETVTALFAGSAWAPIVFHDTDSIENELANLKRDDTVEDAVVFEGESVLASMSRDDIPASQVMREVGVVLDRERLYDTREIQNPDGAVVGRVTITFSLAAENARDRALRWQLGGRASILALTTIVLLVFITRWKVIRPLMSLVNVAKRIELGDLRVRAIDHGGNAEMTVLAHAFSRMSVAIADRETRLLDELEIAANLQTSILPDDPRIDGLSIAAYMEPATEVGGDYYDVIPTPDGCWMAVGDVSGHGLGAGVIMLMLQSSIAALVRATPDASPARIAVLVNEVLFDNVRTRMKRRDHATLTILRYTRDGRVRIAGAHEDILVLRSATGEVERIETPGTWVGAVRSIAAVTEETSFVLGDDDVMVLYTDGVTEARRHGQQLGLDAIEDLVRRMPGASPAELKNAIVTAVHEWTSKPEDDISVVVVQQLARGVES